MSTLSPKMKKVYIKYYGENRLQSEIAADLGITPGRVSQIITNIESRFRNERIPVPQHVRDGRGTVR
jgi:DNA-directed RNA polymerase specialized sigma subunit